MLQGYGLREVATPQSHKREACVIHEFEPKRSTSGAPKTPRAPKRFTCCASCLDAEHRHALGLPRDAYGLGWRGHELPPPAAARRGGRGGHTRVADVSFSSFCCTGRAGLGARGAELLRDEAQRGALWVGMRCVRGPCASERAR